MGMVKLGHDNIELWTKHLREPQYTQQPLTTFGEIEEPNIQLIITTPKFGQSPPKGRGKPYNYSTLQQQTPQRVEQEKVNEAESAQNIPQGEIEAASNYNTLQEITRATGNEETFNQNAIQRMIDEVENETTLNPNILQEMITPNTDIFQGMIKDVQNDISINQNILKELTQHPQQETTTDQNPSHNINQQQATLKRYMENNESEGISPKRPNMTDEVTDDEMIIDDIIQSPGWKDKYPITVTSPIEENNLDLENHLKKLKEMINQQTTPTTPIRRRTRSQEKDTPTKCEQNYKNSRTRSQDTKDKSINNEQIMNIIENKNNHGKTNIKGTQRTNKSGNKGRNQKPNTDNKIKETDKEQKQDNSNKIDNELNIATSTPKK